MHICNMHYKSKDLARKTRQIRGNGDPVPGIFSPRIFSPGDPVPVPGLLKNTGESPRPRRGPRPRATIEETQILNLKILI